MAEKFRSKFEGEFAEDLKNRGVKYKYEDEKIPYTVQVNYVPDFIITTKSKKKLYIETKGRFTQYDRKKMLLVKKQHSDKDIRLVFYRASEKLYKGAKSTYGEWATRHGFLWSERVVPKEWLNE